MIIDIGKHDFSIVWEGVYYHALSDYPFISEWELKRIVQFVEYENLHKRETKIKSESQTILDKVNYALNNRDKYIKAKKPTKVTQCTACMQKGCVTKFLCHTSSIEDAISIFKCGKLLSAVNARNSTSKILSLQQRNAAKDPTDYFDYIMFAWGNCIAGDRLVMERKLNRNPNEGDLSTNFTPGIRFYFKYDTLLNHPFATFDGYHPIKIKDAVILSKYLFIAIIPSEYKSFFESIVPKNLKDRVFYIQNDCKDIFEWTDKIYNFVRYCKSF